MDIQLRTNVAHIFAIGDIVGQPMLAHKAVHEAHVAAEVIAGEIQGNKELAASAFNARVIPSVAYTDPEVAWVGLTEDQAKAQGIKVKKGLFPWTASGRAIANGRDEGAVEILGAVDAGFRVEHPAVDVLDGFVDLELQHDPVEGGLRNALGKRSIELAGVEIIPGDIRPHIPTHLLHLPHLPVVQLPNILLLHLHLHL